MSLDNDFLDLGKPKHNSVFGIVSTSLAALWLGLLIIPRFFGIYLNTQLFFILILTIQLIGLITAIISIRKNETRRILYLIGLIINGVGFLYFALNSLF